MDVKLVLLIFAVLMVVLVDAVFLYNRELPKEEDLEELNLKCIPGRTVIKITEKPVEQAIGSSDEDEFTRRSHMSSKTNDETCQICVCSVEGKDEYCSNRPAVNVNECIRMATINEDYNSNVPYDLSRILSYSIRRDLIWHNDEIPYKQDARCKRSHTYYSNSQTANSTDTIDLPDEMESWLDFENNSMCYYCVCSVNGVDAGCMERDPWFCEYYRNLKRENAARDRYRIAFGYDAPTYERQLPWRLRRTMDNGMFDLVESGGDALCCDHPSGHRRNLHSQIRNKIRQLRRKVPKENLMEGDTAGDYVDFIVNNDK